MIFNSFFIIFLSTVLITRFFLFIKPTPSPIVGNFRVHHYMYGIIGIVIGLLIHSVFVYAIGLGLFIDELTYLIIKGKDHKDNYSKVSLFGTLIFVIIVYFLRDYLILFFV
ncbi:MAG: hypothetical protein V4699_00400 [Patescibacteria group bacterium]